MVEIAKADDLVAKTALSVLDLIVPYTTPEDALSMTPFGDAMDVYTLGKSLYDRDYFSAGLAALNFAIPNVVEIPLKYLGRGAKRLLHNSKYSKLAKEMENSLMSSLFAKSPNRTRDFKEVESPEIMIHADKGNGVGAYTRHGAYTKDETLNPGKAKKPGQRDFIWFNQSNPYALSVHNEPMERVFIGEADNIPGLTRVKDMNEPVGQYPGKGVKARSFVLNSEHVTPEPVSLSNLVQYNLDPYEHSMGRQVYVKEGQPMMRQYGTQEYTYRDSNNNRQGYVTQGTSQHSEKLDSSHYKEDVINLQNPVLSGPVNDVKVTRYQSEPKYKEITNWQEANKGTYVGDFIPEEYITLQDGTLGRVIGEYHNMSLDPSRVVQSVKRPQLFDNKHRFVSTNPDQYIYTDWHHVPLTLWHKFGGRLSRSNKLIREKFA